MWRMPTEPATLYVCEECRLVWHEGFFALRGTDVCPLCESGLIAPDEARGNEWCEPSQAPG